MLEEFGRDLTALATIGALEPLIGRQQEIKKIIEILLLEGKNNIVLVGPPGVGKTCIVEGLAQFIVSGNVPDKLKNKKIFQLDFASLVSGTIYRGMLEERIEKIIYEIVDYKDIILFIDELHLIKNTHSTGHFDLSSYLKPFLDKGELQIIGATTEDEFKRQIEEVDPAFARRFIKINIDEPPKEELRILLTRFGKRLGSKHNIVVPEYTISKVIEICDKYIKDRYFPDKGIDILKEAIAEKSFTDELDRNTRDLTLLQPVLHSEINALLSVNLEKLDETLNNWDEQKKIFFDRALTPEDIAKIVAKKTGAVISETQLDEISYRIQKLQEAFKLRVVGQNRSKEAIISAFKMLAAGIRKKNKPVGSFLFLGPSGSGKTETAKTIAAAFFGDEKKLIRFDMSEFYGEHTVARLIGSPPGYVGSEEDGLLYKLISKNPFSVVLFDEIEKADPKLFDVFLQMLDEGIVKDMKGNVASFKDALIIITSNVGTHLYAGLTQKDFENKFEVIQTKVIEELKRVVRPEIVNRIDYIIPFSPFTKEELKLILKKLVDESCQNIYENKQITYTLTENAINFAIEQSYDPQFGARPLKREIQKIEALIADAILDKLIQTNDKIIIDVSDEQYKLKKVFE